MLYNVLSCHLQHSAINAVKLGEVAADVCHVLVDVLYGGDLPSGLGEVYLVYLVNGSKCLFHFLALGGVRQVLADDVSL